LLSRAPPCGFTNIFEGTIILVKEARRLGMMPDIKDLIVHLAGIHITDRSRRRAYDVAGHLVALKERWHKTPDRQRQTLIRASGNRLWGGYMKKRRDTEITPKEAAREAIFDEQSILEELLNPNYGKPGLLGQLPDS
jgi:hypothetical protein